MTISSSNYNIFLSVILLFFVNVLGSAYAEEQEQNTCLEDTFLDEAFPEEPEDEATSILSFFDIPYEYISSNVESLARNMDEYFSSDKVVYESSGTLIRLRSDVIWEEGRGAKLKTDLRFKLRLPLTQKKLRVDFQSRVNNKNFEGLLNGDETSLLVIEREQDYKTKKSGEEKSAWRFMPSIGAYLDSRIDTYVKFRFNYQQSFDAWDLNWDNIPYWVDSIGWAFDNYLDLNRKIGQYDLFRSSTAANWRRDNNYFELSQFFSITQRINEKSAISYFSGIYGIDEPTLQTTQYILGINYRTSLRKKYLFFEIRPEVRYRKIYRFRPEHAITFRFEVLFRK